MSSFLTDWTVDYGDGPRPMSVPHAWRQDVPVSWEGPAIYRTLVDVPTGPSWLVFRGVSYSARVLVKPAGARSSVEAATLTVEHLGIWDPFSLNLSAMAGQRVEVEVTVVKNGGPTYPVKEVLSGFLPYVFHTFGGIFGEVELVLGPDDPLVPVPPAEPRAKARGTQIWIDGAPRYLRGLLHWGWYPELGHPNPDAEIIRREVRAAKAMGFNLVKFCLWTPPERYLQILHEEGMFAWMELPLWDPSPHAERLAQMADEIERIARRLAQYPAIVLWTIGCELSTSTPYEFRRQIVERIRDATGSALVKDNSGGAEMYGGDPREVGDFDDFHPYCDLTFYPDVLDSLLPGPRDVRPTLLGEFNDLDVHRDLPRLAREMPYWASPEPALNDQGVRWQHDLPGILNRWREPRPDDPVIHAQAQLADASRSKARFVRKFVQEEVRSREPIGGCVVTGWRDTPISTSGFFDDWGEPRFTLDDLAAWNGPDTLFLIPRRRPPWVKGGNRPGWEDPFNHFMGPILFRIGVHSEVGGSGPLRWQVEDSRGGTVAMGVTQDRRAVALCPVELGEAWWEPPAVGTYTLKATWGEARNAWKLWVVPKFAPEAFGEWALHDPGGRFAGLQFGRGPNLLATRLSADVRERLASGSRVVVFKGLEGLAPMPFWRESIHLIPDQGWDTDDVVCCTLRTFGNEWERWMPIAPDAALDLAWFEQVWGARFETLMSRVDTRTYAQHPYVMRAHVGEGELIVSSLRPEGGLGRQPSSLLRSPAGCALVAGLMGNLPPA